MASEKMITQVLSRYFQYPNYPKEAESIARLKALWLDVCCGVEDEFLAASVAEHLKSDSKYMPMPGEMRTRALRLAERAKIEKVHETKRLAASAQQKNKHCAWVYTGMGMWRVAPIDNEAERQERHE